MPQPLTERQLQSTTWNALTLEQRPECAMGVARVAGAWAFLEFWLGELFVSATGDAELDEQGNIEITGHPLASASLGALESITAKLDVIAAGIEAFLPQMSGEFEQLRIGIRACAKERNRIVHSVWGVNHRYPEDVIRVVQFTGECIKYTPRDFSDTVDRILMQVRRVRDFDGTCVQARHNERPQEPV